MTILEEALNCPKCVISVMGDHAGESVVAIFDRKIDDIGRIGKTFWLIRSSKAKPGQVQSFCKKIPVYVILVEPATKGGARATKRNEMAKEYSNDKRLWHQLPGDLSPVTGKLDSGAAALVFDMMTRDVSGTLDLWSYGELSESHKPLKFILGCSTVCAVRVNTGSHPGKMKSRYREIAAVARLARPYCVWLR